MKLKTLYISILSIALIQQSILAGAPEQEETQENQAPWIYDVLSGYNYLIVPIVAGGAGAVVAGPVVGFATGASLAIIDELLIENGYADSYTFTSGIMGAGTLSTLNAPYYLNTITGFVLGMLINAGMFEDLHQYAGGIIQGGIAGQVYSGSPLGALAGAGANIADEFLNAYEITDQDYLTSLATSLAQAKVLSSVMQMLTLIPTVGPFFDLGIDAETIALIILPVKISPTETESTKPDAVEAPKSPTEVLESLKETLYGIMDPTTLDRILNKQAIVLIGTQILTSRMILAKDSYSQDFGTRLAQFKNLEARTLPNFYQTLGEFTLLLVPLITHEITSTLITDHYSRLFSEAAQEELKETYFSNGNLLKLSRDPNTEVLVDRMDINILDTTIKGGSLLSSAVKSYVGGAYAVCLLYSYQALDLGQLIQTYIESVHSITISLNEKQLYYENTIEELRSKLVSFQKEINRNAKLIASGDKETLLLKKQTELIEELRILKRDQAVQKALVSTWISFEMTMESILEFGFVALKMAKGEIPFDKYMATIGSSNNLANSYSWYSKNAAEITAYNKAMIAVNELLEKMKQEGDPRIAEANTATYHTQKGTTNKLLCENFSVGHEDATLVDNQTFELEPKVYSVSGKSGSGKSSFLSKIKGTQYNGIWAQGSITYTTRSGKEPIIHQASQEDYILPYSTLLEVIALKDRQELEANPQIQERVTELLREIGIDDKEDDGLIAMLNEERDWRAILSGGQKKKIAIVTAILKNPDIAILDEIFNGLDRDSVITAQNMLKRELPGTIFLIVDHNYEEHNHGFYAERVHLEDRKVMILQR